MAGNNHEVLSPHDDIQGAIDILNTTVLTREAVWLNLARAKYEAGERDTQRDDQRSIPFKLYQDITIAGERGHVVHLHHDWACDVDMRDGRVVTLNLKPGVDDQEGSDDAK